jgi:hypothetical protein
MLGCVHVNHISACVCVAHNRTFTRSRSLVNSLFSFPSARLVHWHSMLLSFCALAFRPLLLRFFLFCFFLLSVFLLVTRT